MIIIKIYKILFPSINRNCRFDPTCSLYAEQAIKKYGTLKGSVLTIKRLISCHPFSKKPFLDPVI